MTFPIATGTAHTITIEPSGRQFQTQPGESLLGAAIRAGVGLPYGCRDGACGSCRSQKMSGTVVHGPHQEKALTPADIAAGMVLTCCGIPQSDVVLESRQVVAEGAFAVRKMPVRVKALERLSPDVMRLNLQLPANDVFAYHVGQYVEFLLPNGVRRSYSIANAPTVMAGPSVELHVRHMPGGIFTDQVFGTLKERDILRVEGPFGSFFLREDSSKPIILLASGTGFAPIKAILERMQAKGIHRPATLYWGGRRPQDLYLDGWVRAQMAQLPQLRYEPVVSDALPEDHWTGRTGFVHLAVLQDLPDLSGHQVYACGAPIVVDSARRDFVAGGLPDHEFFADAFTSAADKNGTQ
jgi:CDP-4-dehydro-6-deoxyglucose reductase